MCIEQENRQDIRVLGGFSLIIKMINTQSSVTSTSDPARIILFGIIVWIFSIQFFIAQVVVHSGWVTPFSLNHNFISDLGNTACGVYPPGSTMYVCSPWHAWMNTSFILQGFITIIGITFVRKMLPFGMTRFVGVMFLILAGVGDMAVGFFPENVNNTYHVLGAGVHFILGNFSMIFLGIALSQAGQSFVTLYSIISGGIGLVATGFFISKIYLGMGIGGMERVAAYPLPLWLIVEGIYWLILGFEDTTPPEPKNRTRKAGLMMDNPKKHVRSMRVR